MTPASCPAPPSCRPAPPPWPVGDLLTARYGTMDDRHPTSYRKEDLKWNTDSSAASWATYSKIIHEMLCGYSYDLLPPAHRGRSPGFPAARQFKAINVTIPYKKLVMEYCSFIDPRARPSAR